MSTIICPKCGTSNADTALNCGQCHISLQWAMQNLAGASPAQLQQQTPALAVPEISPSIVEDGIGQRNMLYGALWCTGGIIITLVTYGMASSGSGGGTYVIAWGAVLFGAIQFFKGLFQCLR